MPARAAGCAPATSSGSSIRWPPGGSVGGRSPRLLSRLPKQEYPTCRVALDWALRNDRGAAVQLLEPLADIGGARGLLREGNDLARHACTGVEPGSVEWAELLAPTAFWLTIAFEDWWIEPAEAVVAEGALSPWVRRRLESALHYPDVFSGSPGAMDRFEELITEARRDGDETFAGICRIVPRGGRGRERGPRSRRCARRMARASIHGSSRVHPRRACHPDADQRVPR